MKHNAYIYPISNRHRTGVINPYLANFVESTESYVNYLNKRNPSDTGIFNLFRYLSKSRFLFLNWIENLPDLKFGLPQTLFVIILLRVRKLLGIKIVWTLHNKVSHSNERIYWKKKLFAQLLRSSDLILTHSSEGVSFAEQMLPGVSSRVYFFPHPVVQLPRHEARKKYDILIWGTLSPYKGVAEFLDYLKRQDALARFRILIAGKAVSQEYFERLRVFESDNIEIRDEFIDTEELGHMIAQSRIVLFTYAGETVLSSGALTDSIAHGANVVGPHAGAFADLAGIGMITTYEGFDELLTKLNDQKIWNVQANGEKLKAFIDSHTWPEFAWNFKPHIENLLE